MISQHSLNNLNKIIRDDFGRPSGILAVNKPIGLTSHDVVYKVRKALHTEKVGHAGALDPFASGILIILVGKATKLSDELMIKDKSYLAEILFGVSTDSQDPEGKILQLNSGKDIVSREQIQTALDTIKGGYTQNVPVYSSVKIDGQKLRVLARKYQSFTTYFAEGKKYVKFVDPNKELVVELPTHYVEFSELTMTDFKEMTLSSYPDHNQYYEMLATNLQEKDPSALEQKYAIATVVTGCPKGTYIRQMAEDIGNLVNPPTPAMLISLQRIKLGEIYIDDAISLEDLAKL